MASSSDNQPRIRAAVAVISDGRILLVQHSKSGRSYWLLPGGGLDWGESLKEAARREVAEETGLEVDVGDLLFVSETLAPDGSKHVVHLVFAGEYSGGEIDIAKEERITDARWVELSAVQGLVLHPPMQAALAKLDVHDLNASPVFLGNLWVD